MIYFIDFENVHLNGLVGLDTLSDKDTVVILYPFSLKSALIKFITDCTTEATIQLHCISVGYKDALDMKLILKAMLMYKAGNTEIAFISKDRIFTGIKDALKEFNYFGRITLAVGTACNDLYRYYCFDYGTLNVYEKVDKVYLNCNHGFVDTPAETFRLIESIEMHPELNIRVHGLHTAEERKELWRLLEAVEEPKCSKELSGIIARESKASAEPPIKTTYALNDNIRRDDEWHKAVFDFCFNFLYSVRSNCKLYDSKVQTVILSTLKRIIPNNRSIDTMLKTVPSFVGCKEQRLRELYEEYAKRGASNV